MSTLVNRNAVKQVELNVTCDVTDCSFPVHWVKLRERYSYMDKMALMDAMNQGVEAMARFRFLKRVQDWNLVDSAGKKLPITQATLTDLSEEWASAVWAAIDELDNTAEEDLPNA